MSDRLFGWAHVPGLEAWLQAVHLPLIDLLLGTHRMPRRGWPEAYGVLQPPVPDGFLRQFVFPLRR